MWFQDLFKKKTKEKESFRKLFSWENEERIKRFRFSSQDESKFMKLVKKYRNMKLYSFKTFIEKIEIIIINNQFKPWYDIKKALNELDKWNYPVYRKISFISNIDLINKYLNKDYIKYNYVFENLDLEKIIHNIWIASKDFDMKLKYEDTVRNALTWFSWVQASFVQFVWIIIASQLIIYPVIMEKMYDLQKWTRLFDRFSYIDQVWLQIFWWLYYVSDWILLWYLWLLFTFWFMYMMWEMLWSWVKVYFLNQSINNKREIDKVSNELSFWWIVLKNIKKLEMWNNTWNFQYVNFKDFFLKCWLEARNRWLVNDKFLTDFSYLFQFFFQFWEMPIWKKFQLSEWFVNILEDILISYKTSLSWSWSFDLNQVYERFVKYDNKIWSPLFEKNYKKIMWTLSTIIMWVMAWWTAINMLVSIQQSNAIKALVWWM